jgi:tRNA(fMet)-specific endonuclease VapC
MDYLFDTNIVSALLKQNKNALKNTDYEIIRKAILFELRNPIFKKIGFLKPCFELRNPIFKKIGFLKHLGNIVRNISDLKKRGQMIQDADILIAAIALVNNLVVVTNEPHFLIIPNLKVENWLRKNK